ncbi:MAG: hypothetical protein PHC62_09145 [Candidatus Izemoplasmatales bacterium]|nr:hypothetical protein [Candidatus Izemoplasmatales bacterium]
MKLDELMVLLKSSKIVDDSELFARVSIIYSETFQAIQALNGNSAQGQDGYIGVCDNFLVLFENTVFGGKPKTEVFRIPLDEIESHSLKNNLFGITKCLRVKVRGKKYKINCHAKYKENLTKIAEQIK